MQRLVWVLAAGLPAIAWLMLGAACFQEGTGGSGGSPYVPPIKQTANPEPTPTPLTVTGPGCPVNDSAVCDTALSLQSFVRDGNAPGILQTLGTLPIACDPDAADKLTREPLCSDAMPGAVLQGVLLFAKTKGVVSPVAFAKILMDAMPSYATASGGTVVLVGCPRPKELDCSQYFAVSFPPSDGAAIAQLGGHCVRGLEERHQLAISARIYAGRSPQMGPVLGYSSSQALRLWDDVKELALVPLGLPRHDDVLAGVWVVLHRNCCTPRAFWLLENDSRFVREMR